MSDLSPAIFRCPKCNAVLHPADKNNPAAWCARCSQFVEAVLDGGPIER
jgi:DNA-directed RNA polymerase subunit M/transcription elongation factor TFIIS